MNKIISFLLCISISLATLSQSVDKLITVAEAERIENILASNDMQGRKAGTPGIEKAADFIASEFKKNGLEYFNALNNYRQEFALLKAKHISSDGSFGNETVNGNNIITITTQPHLDITQSAGYEKVLIAKDANFIAEITKVLEADKNLLVIIDTSHAKKFSKTCTPQQQTFIS